MTVHPGDTVNTELSLLDNVQTVVSVRIHHQVGGDGTLGFTAQTGRHKVYLILSNKIRNVSDMEAGMAVRW